MSRVNLRPSRLSEDPKEDVLVSVALRGSLCLALCLATSIAGLTAETPAPGQTAAQPAGAEQPAVKPNAFRKLPEVPLYSGPAPLRADWPGRIAGRNQGSHLTERRSLVQRRRAQLHGVPAGSGPQYGNGGAGGAGGRVPAAVDQQRRQPRRRVARGARRRRVRPEIPSGAAGRSGVLDDGAHAGDTDQCLR